MKKLGFFVSFEGIDGCGKTSQSRMLAQSLRSCGHDVIETREPFLDLTRQKLRHRLSPGEELSLFLEDRRTHIDTVILPAISAGKIVLCDRFVDSTMAYQGFGNRIGSDSIANLPEQRLLLPDITIFLDVPLNICQERISRRGKKDRFDLSPLSFHERVIEGYLFCLNRNPERIRSIPGDRDPSLVQEDILRLVLPLAARPSGHFPPSKNEPSYPLGKEASMNDESARSFYQMMDQNFGSPNMFGKHKTLSNGNVRFEIQQKEWCGLKSFVFYGEIDPRKSRFLGAEISWQDKDGVCYKINSRSLPEISRRLSLLRMDSTLQETSLPASTSNKKNVGI
ncbi:Thymidylate kinase [Leptospirillum ferriphilum]|uniref:Thymidylate kinase n=1 Tax=Leptospirillum ferriphilum TaxID=178606 RepID=A0A094WBG5_9BACT|nr:dTMP kinase [Leptospirillum ferriphilum]KGA93850.1 Thymidylate kinase [Leptospirillum ferriphilum]